MGREKIKQDKIITMFDNIAHSYDKTNKIISMGMDKAWREKACLKALKIYDKDKIDLIIDIACGTGEMTHTWEKQKYSIKKIIGIDPSKKMINLAEKKYKNLFFKISTADKLPISKESVDLLSISFGIRNILDRSKAFEEFYRVLKPKGLGLILEFTKDENFSLIKPFKEFYLKNILPKIGSLLSKNKEAYEYLPNSVENFATKDELINELINKGFNLKFSQNFSFNTVSLIIVEKC